MIFVTHKSDHADEKAQADALRRYLRDKTAGRRASEYVYPQEHGGSVIAWVGCSETEQRKYEGSRRFRKPGPWCEVLGRDTSISGDHALMAFLEMRSSGDLKEDAYEWALLLREVASNRVRALRKFRAAGLEIVARQSCRQLSSSPSAANCRGLVSAKYLKRGEGLRPLKYLRTDTD